MSTQKTYKKYVTFRHFMGSDYEITTKIQPNYKTSIPCKMVDGHLVWTEKQAVRRGDSEHTIRNAKSSRTRACKNLFDVLRSNTWTYFVTLTFEADGFGADETCRKLFSSWSKFIRSNYPHMYYVAVPEYHKKGDLHFHLVVGGVSKEELGLVYSGRVVHKGQAWIAEDFINAGFVVDEETGEGFPVFNVTTWSDGFSTATEVRSSKAVAKYISKYLSKANIDPRFFNKRRFYTSHNVNRPVVVKENTITTCPYLDNGDIGYFNDTYGAVVNYGNPLRAYRKYDVSDLSKEDVIKLRLQGVLPMQSHN